MRKQILEKIKEKENEFLKNNPDKKIDVIVVGVEHSENVSLAVKQALGKEDACILVVDLTEEETKEIEKDLVLERSIPIRRLPELFPTEVEVIEDIRGRDVENMKKQQKLSRKHFNKNMSKNFKKR
jgi:hypothetical protein